MKKSALLTSLAFAAALAACTKAPAPAETAPAPGSAPEAGAAPTDTSALPLPIPVNSVMVSLVDFAADGIWRPAGLDEPMTDKQWLLAEKDAIDIIASATLITTAGTGVNDAMWVADPEWRSMARQMQQIGLAAKSAIDARDKAALKTAGDQLVEVCQACHQKYKPGLPSMGITRFPVYPKYPDQ